MARIEQSGECANGILVAIGALRAQLDALELMVKDTTRSDGDKLVSSADRPFELRPATFQRWAREGRLKAFTAERGRIVAWLSDVRRAVEAQPVTTTGPATDDHADELDSMIADGTLVEGSAA